MAGEEKVRRYRAFIAYSHQDKRWAAWLHRRLEFYRVPHRLVGRTTVAGTINRRLTPIFRDREELATAEDLGEKISQALQHSDNLIVVCSPAAARSQWVNEEILRFRRNGSGTRIFCLIVGGEPLAVQNGGSEAEECFPPALRRGRDHDGCAASTPAEPLAADVRHGQDRRGLALLKLIAGILALDLDELRRRDLQRRNRRWAGVSALALVVMAATSLLALEAVVQRNVAEQRRAQAEGLVAFMLGNLRAELKPIGRLDLMDMVGKRVLAYYSSQKLASMNAASLERRAQALRLIGGVYDQRGHLNEALSVYRRAEATTAQLLANEPDDPERIFEHAQSVFYVAAIAHERGDLAHAETGFRQYYELAQRLVRINPDNAKWQREVAYAVSNLGILLLAEKKYQNAVKVFRKGVAMFSAQAQKYPRDVKRKTDLATMRGWLADAERYLGNFKEARHQRMMQLAIYQKLQRDAPDNSDFHYDLATAYRALVHLAVDTGDLTDAEARSKAVIKVSSALVKQDATNTAWQEIDAAGWMNLGEVLYARSEFNAARKAAAKARDMAGKLFAKNSTVIAWITIMAQDRLLLARLAAHEGRHEDALETARSLGEAIAAMPASKRSLTDVESLLLEARLLQGDELRALGRTGSVEAWNDVLRIARANTGSLTPGMRTSIAGAYLRLGKTREAGRIIEWLDGIGYRAPAFANLKKRFAGRRTEQVSASTP